MMFYLMKTFHYLGHSGKVWLPIICAHQLSWSFSWITDYVCTAIIMVIQECTDKLLIENYIS